MIIYRIEEESSQVIPTDIMNMDEWVEIISDKEFQYFFNVCSKEDLSEDDESLIFKYAIILYCRELGLDEISLSNEFVYKLISTFIANINIVSLRRKGLVETDGPLFLYKSCKTKLT